MNNCDYVNALIEKLIRQVLESNPEPVELNRILKDDEEK